MDLMQLGLKQNHERELKTCIGVQTLLVRLAARQTENTGENTGSRGNCINISLTWNAHCI